MRRSEVNKIILEVEKNLQSNKFFVPKLSMYSLENWRQVFQYESEIVDTMLGWDISDFGLGNFYDMGIVSFVLRNGSYNNPAKYPKKYCEKMIYVFENQVLPSHFHWTKEEDIINRGGGKLVVTLWSSDNEENYSSKPLTISLDGKKKQ